MNNNNSTYELFWYHTGLYSFLLLNLYWGFIIVKSIMKPVRKQFKIYFTYRLSEFLLQFTYFLSPVISLYTYIDNNKSDRKSLIMIDLFGQSILSINSFNYHRAIFNQIKNDEKPDNKINNHEEILEEKSVNQYNFKDNNIFYFRGDVFKVKQLEKFKNNILDGKVDILFSDAHHSFEGLMSEYKNLIYDILSDKFILYYDDLKFHGPTNKRIDMTDAFFLISRELKKKNKNLTVALLDVNGWLGNHEHKHTNGIITTLNLKQILSQNNINLNIQYFDL